MELNYRWIQYDRWFSNRIIITVGQLRDDLSFPLHDSANPFFYEALTKIQRGSFQLNENAIRIMNEFVIPSKGGPYQIPKFAKDYNPEDYNIDSFFANYSDKTMSTRRYQEWGIKLARNTLEDSSKALLRDVDPFGRAKNGHLRWSNDEDWMMFPLVVEGPLYPTPLPCLLKDRKKRDPTTESPAYDQNDPVNTPTAAGHVKRTRRTLNLAELTRVKDSKIASSQPTPPPKQQPTSSHQDVISSDLLKGVHPSLPNIPIVEVGESPEKLSKDTRPKYKKKINKDKRKLYEANDPTYLPDLDFLKDIYTTAQQNEAISSPSIGSLISFCTDTFTALDQSEMENASLNLSISQHTALMALEFNRHFANLVETRASCGRLEEAKIRIQKLEKELDEERNFANKLEKKAGELRSKTPYFYVPLLCLRFIFVIFLFHLSSSSVYETSNGCH
ncbi:uncharacterized protein LOC113311844 [Papaver somniferum]|uniref:uncharacterized protein LOC113311844 n=1 Tax=Papaver somniferum TaxID=3469 RepID=UPI000E6F68FA|nr:uncharacterized protein LOC113311844 [Papaver somniferum]